MPSLTDSPFLNPSALEPLFLPWEEPRSQHVRANKEGEPAQQIKGRRSSAVTITIHCYRTLTLNSNLELQL